MKYKIVVAHPAQQHSYRLATALKKAGMLEKYITTVYFKKNSLTRFTSEFLKGDLKEKAVRRRCEELGDRNVKQYCELLGLVKLACMHLKILNPMLHFINYLTADLFSVLVALYAIRKKVDAVVFYDDTSPIGFKILKKFAPHIVRILDVSAISRVYMKDIYKNDIRMAPSFSDKLRNEVGDCFENIKMEKRFSEEIELSQKFIVPSEIVKKSLIYSGVSDNDIRICPYGVDINEFQCAQKEKSEVVRFVYVGGVKELKGIYYLLEAFQDIPHRKATLSIVGDVDLEAKYLQKYKNNVTFIGRVLHDEIPEVLSKYDVFIFPSLGDGYGLAAMEAAACGLPLIVTENSGIADIVKDGWNGFIIPAQDKEAIVRKARWFIDNSSEIKEMGKRSRKAIESMTWDTYYRKVSECITDMIYERK